jgi:cephalosporin-C deacetylase
MFVLPRMSLPRLSSLASRVFLSLGAAVFAYSVPSLPAAELASVPAPASQRIATAQIRVVPNRPDWTYALGQKATFFVQVIWDQHPLDGMAVSCTVGPEMVTHEAKKLVVPAAGLTVDGGTLTEPGFIRCAVTAEIEGKTYRGLATAGFAPGEIKPTQTEPADFDAFWSQGKADLANIPLDARVQLIPEASTGKINVYHVSFRSWSQTNTAQYQGRIYGILCEPKAPGKYPALLRVPGAGVRPYSGARDLAERGVITLDIGIHGIPVNLAPEIYDQMRTGALDNYMVYNLDNKNRYYYRRVYLGCVRANDFLTSRENWDGKNLVVMGGSQGGQLTLVTTALDPRVTAAAAQFPAYCDVTGYVHGRAGGWPHMMRREEEGHRTPEKLETTSYYDTVNFARRVKVPTHVAFGYNDETCPPTSMFAAYNVISAPKELLLALEMTHGIIPEVDERVKAWALAKAGVK